MLCSPIRSRALLSGWKVQSIHRQCFGGIFAKVEVVLPQGLEPWVPCLRDRCFNQFSYRSLLRLGGGTWTHESSDLQSVPLATLVLQDNRIGRSRTYTQILSPVVIFYRTLGIPIPLIFITILFVLAEGIEHTCDLLPFLLCIRQRGYASILGG